MQTLGRGGGRRSINIWPGFVDALATLLLVVIFVLMVFMVAQYFLTTALTGRDIALQRLERQVAELAEILSLERAANAELRVNVTQLSDELQASLAQRQSLSGQLAAIAEERDTLERILADAEAEAKRVSAELEEAYKVVDADKEKIETQLVELAILQSLRDELMAELDRAQAAAKEGEEDAEAMAARLAEQANLSEEAQRKVDLLNRQVLALRQQLASLQEILDASAAENEARQVQIAELTQKLNLALATKVQELKRYRSEFFGRLREVLGNRAGIRVVGDRFVFQSEVLFQS
ncbi:MAG: chemotaxis protein, partial [Rhodospirillales bacterium]|nr:chemotaxis protein [Rhodospirillales bacterium]